MKKFLSVLLAVAMLAALAVGLSSCLAPEEAIPAFELLRNGTYYTVTVCE